MKRLIYGLIVLLAILHQDFWFWDRYEPLALGFMPIGLAYHACVSVAAAMLWAAAVRYCWPHELDVIEESSTRPRASAGNTGETPVPRVLPPPTPPRDSDA